MRSKIVFLRLLICLLILPSFSLSGCAYFDKVKKFKWWSPQKKEKAKPMKSSVQRKKPPAPKPVDEAAQKRYYKLGLKHYSEENYDESQKAWQQVIDLGSNTTLAGKAQEYLKKTNQILKTLDEIER